MRRVARLVRTRVEVAVVFRQQVDVVEEVALVITSPVCLREANVEQHAAVETARRRLSRPTISYSYFLLRDVNLLTSDSHRKGRNDPSLEHQDEIMPLVRVNALSFLQCVNFRTKDVDVDAFATSMACCDVDL